MCGILGVVNFGSRSIRELQQYLKQGSIVGTLRGDDSTGMFQMRKDKRYRIHKLPYSGEVFATTKGFKSLEYYADEPGFTILHHRAATKGSVTQDNAHPFEHSADNKLIVGVHNGTLTTSPSAEDGKTFDVDSDYLLYTMMRDGAEKALGKARGAIASVWMERDGNLRIFTNGERTISFGIIKNENAMVIASEPAMLYWLASRVGLKLEAVVIPDNNVIHTFVFGGDVRDFSMQAVEVPASPQNFWSHRGTTSTSRMDACTGTSNDQFREREAFLNDLGLRRGDSIPFWPEEDGYDVDSRILTGWSAVGSDFFSVKLYGISPGIAHALKEAPEVVVTVRLAGGSATGAVELHIIAGDPRVVEEESESKDAPFEYTVPGPSGGMSLAQFYAATNDGCMYCSRPLFPADATQGNITWVNGGANAACTSCVNKL